MSEGSSLRLIALALAIIGLHAGVARAQTTLIPQPAPGNTPPGWVVTPSVGVAELWDDNVALTSEAAGTTGDYVSVVNPSLSLGYRGRYSTVTLDYRGGFEFHRRLTEFDSSDHLGRADLRRRLNNRVTLFARDYFSSSPTTAIIAPSTGLTVLRRRTTRFNEFLGGVEYLPTARTTINATYTSQWIELARDVLVSPLLRGGRSDGADVEWLQALSPRLSVGARYEGQLAVVAEGGAEFNVQHARGLLQFALSPGLRFNGAYGLAYQTTDGESDTAPAYELGLIYQRPRLNAEVQYIRAFLPSFGFGGTVQNEELRGNLQARLSRIFQLTATASRRGNDPLDRRAFNLESTSFTGAFAYLPTEWLRVEVFTIFSDQDSGVAGGQLTRSQTGIRISTQHPVRLR